MKSTSCFLLISVLAGIFYADMAYAETETLTSKQIIGILPNKNAWHAGQTITQTLRSSPDGICADYFDCLSAK